MLSIEFTDAFYQGSVCFFTILVWYYYLIGALNKRALMRVIVMSLLLGAGSVFVRYFLFDSCSGSYGRTNYSVPSFGLRAIKYNDISC